MLPNVTASTGGMYTCIVSNNAGNDSASTFLFVDPYFVSHPSSHQVSIGATVLLICDALSFPNPEYLWQHSGGGSINSGSRTLNISNVQYGDEGEYFCNASTLGTTIQSRSGLLTGDVEKGVSRTIITVTLCLMYIVSPLANLANTSINITYTQGDMAILECTSLGGPNNAYQWQINGSIVNGETTGTLMLPNVTSSTGGMYTCIISNIAGNDSASTFVFVDLYFVSHPSSHRVSIGATVLLICDALSFPNPEFQWQRVGGELFRHNLVTNERNLTISSVEYGDEGEYVCRASTRGRFLESQIAIVTGNYFFALHVSSVLDATFSSYSGPSLI
jgi:hypothetical protein